MKIISEDAVGLGEAIDQCAAVYQATDQAGGYRTAGHPMSAALTAHGDPVLLVPGDLSGVRAMARELGGLARQAGDTSGVLRSIEGGSWVGPAGEAFRERIGAMPSRLETAADAFHDAGRAFDG